MSLSLQNKALSNGGVGLPNGGVGMGRGTAFRAIRPVELASNTGDFVEEKVEGVLTCNDRRNCFGLDGG